MSLDFLQKSYQPCSFLKQDKLPNSLKNTSASISVAVATVSLGAVMATDDRCPQISPQLCIDEAEGSRTFSGPPGFYIHSSHLHSFQNKVMRCGAVGGAADRGRLSHLFLVPPPPLRQQSGSEGSGAREQRSGGVT